MSAVLPRTDALHGAPRGVAAWLKAWASMGTRHLAAWLLASAVMFAVDLAAMIDKLHKPGIPIIIAWDLGIVLMLFGVTLLGWVAATAGAPARGRERNVAVAWALLVSAAVATSIAVPLMCTLELDKVWWEMMGKTKPPPHLALIVLGTVVQFVTWAAFFIAAAEVLHRRALTNEAIRTAQREQSNMARDVLESRLAAMQAQVEPQFLFETLVDVERLYEKDGGRAAENLDRLITYLRVALPRLRETGSTMAAEIELIQSYLEVVRALHDGVPVLTVTLANDCRDARFYPMLLLPLVQRAVREGRVLPASIRIAVQRVDDDIVLVLRIAAPGGCTEDREIARVRERLAGLYGSRASLDCIELGDTTQLTLRIPVAAPPPV